MEVRVFVVCLVRGAKNVVKELELSVVNGLLLLAQSSKVGILSTT